MANIEVSIEIGAQRDKVWNVVADLDNEPKFWKGTKEIRNIVKKENTISREITIAFRDQKCMQEIELKPEERIEIKFTKGIIDGDKIITLITSDKKTILKVNWNIRLTGMMGMFTGIIKNHIENGTKQALQKIKEEIEK